MPHATADQSGVRLQAHAIAATDEKPQISSQNTNRDAIAGNVSRRSSRARRMGSKSLTMVARYVLNRQTPRVRMIFQRCAEDRSSLPGEIGRSSVRGAFSGITSKARPCQVSI